MTIERAIEILDPDHKEHYESLEPVNEACRMGIKALEWMQTAQAIHEWTPWISVDDELPDEGDEVLGVAVLQSKSGGNTYGAISIVFWDATKKRFRLVETERYDTVTITHWVPLPPLP